MCTSSFASRAHKHVAVCAGKGSHALNQSAAMRVSIKDVCAGGRLVFLLEGGYDLKALGESVAETFRGLLGKVLTQQSPYLPHNDPFLIDP